MSYGTLWVDCVSSRLLVLRSCIRMGLDPWRSLVSSRCCLNLVVIESFHRESIGDFVIRSPLPRPVQKIKINRNAPHISTVERVTKLPIQRVPVQKRPMTVEKERYERLLVPREEAAKLKKHAPEVEKKILKPKVKKTKPE